MAAGEDRGGRGPGDGGLLGSAGHARFTCPRCGAVGVVARFYGPCDECRDELGETMRNAPGEVEVEAYAPKVNVVPNHVATKE
ncbi:MAG: hypothetical protein M0Z33_13805 [Actinomycetota bacterium]|nr:hypothetical protein [Actinomycetota bacterium]